MNSWGQQLEDDLSWREAEMVNLKLLLATSAKNSERQRALLRSCCAMVYAHYEGFCKFCWTLLLETIELEEHRIADLTQPLALRSLAVALKRVRGNASDINLWQFATDDFANELKKKAAFPEPVDTKSNLWVKVAAEINVSVGLECPLFAVHKMDLDRLVALRNDIAHGKKLSISKMEEFQVLEQAATLVMHELAVQIVETLEKKKYLRVATVKKRGRHQPTPQSVNTNTS